MPLYQDTIPRKTVSRRGANTGPEDNRLTVRMTNPMVRFKS